MKFDIEPQGHTTYGEVDPDDSWDRPDTSFSLTGWEFVRTKHGEFDLDVSAGDEVYFVYADYNSGDTFGNDDGEISVMDAFKTREEAESLSEALHSPPVLDSKGRATFDKNYRVDHNGRQYYKFWVGYFESLNSIEVDRVRAV